MMSLFSIDTNKPKKKNIVKEKKPIKVKKTLKEKKKAKKNKLKKENTFVIKNHIVLLNNYKYNNINLKNNIQKNNFKKPIGLYDPLGENINPLTGKPYQNLYESELDKYESGSLAGKPYYRSYKNLSYIWTNQIMYKHVTEMMNSIRNNQITMIKAGTGVGKTLLTPKVALQAFNFQKKVICTVPKRALARSNASFSAKCLDVLLGQEVGYFFSGEKNKTDDTKLVFTTSGSLKSLVTGSEPLLKDYQCILIDEVHERSIDTDFLMLMMKEILEKRPDFRLVLMSATVDVSKFKDYFNAQKQKITFNEIIVEGKLHDVKVHYEKKPLHDWKASAVEKTIHLLKTTQEGDILIFMKAGNEGGFIKQQIESATKHLKEINPFVIILESKTPSDEQDYATDKFKYLQHPDNDPENPFNRKVVIATNVAESSVTIDGVVYVIDNGYEIESSYYPRQNARSLLEERISKASAKQRKGRAGRTKPGECFRLYTEQEFEKFKEYSTPEIQKTDITSDILDLFKLPYVKNTGDLKKYLNTLMDPPKNEFIVSSMMKLNALGATNNTTNQGTITQMGLALSKFRKFDVHISKAIIASAKLNCMYEVIQIILISFMIDNRMESLFNKYRPSRKDMSEREKTNEEKEFNKLKKQFYSPYGDFITILNVYESLKQHMNVFIKKNKINENATNKEDNSNNENNNNSNEKNNLTINKKKLIKEAQRWCYDNGVNAKPFIDKGMRNKSWDRIRNDTRQLTQILNRIVLSKNFKNLNNVLISRENLGNQKNNAKKVLKQNGGKSLLNFIESNVLKDKVHNILLAFCIGGITNIAYIHDKKNLIYKTCFPQERMLCRLDPNSSLSSSNATQFIIYNELFMLRKGASTLKLNIISKIPADVLKIMKKYYALYYNKCLVKNNKSSYKKK